MGFSLTALSLSFLYIVLLLLPSKSCHCRVVSLAKTLCLKQSSVSHTPVKYLPNSGSLFDSVLGPHTMWAPFSNDDVKLQGGDSCQGNTPEHGTLGPRKKSMELASLQMWIPAVCSLPCEHGKVLSWVLEQLSPGLSKST